VLISSHRKLLSSKAMVVNVAEKSERDFGRYDWDAEHEAYTAVAWGVGVSHEMMNLRERKPPRPASGLVQIAKIAKPTVETNG
jgi:hypothetical protein